MRSINLHRFSSFALVVLLIFVLLLLLPFATADSLSSLLSHYDDAKQDFEKTKAELQECQRIDTDCEDVEDALLDPAVDYAKASINVMLAYLDYAADSRDSSEITQAENSLKDALDDLQYVDSKEDFDAVLSSVKTVWKAVADIVKEKTLEDLKEDIADLVEKGKLIDAKLECGIGELEKSNSDLNNLDSAYDDFSAQIDAAEKELEEAESALSQDAAVAVVLSSLKNAQAALKNSQTPLATARDALSSAGGSLCTEVTLEDADEEDTEDEESEDAEEADETEEEAEDTEDESEDEEEEKDIDELLDEYGLTDYYEDAADAVETLVDYIEEKQSDGYDTSEAEDVLAEAEDYLSAGEELVLESAGKGAFSKFLNALQTAQRGLKSDYYSEGSGSSSSSSATSDYAAFVTCMEDASYAYQREDCYDTYSIDDGTAEDIESCLDAAASSSEEEDCYEEAEDEAEEQDSADADELESRLDAVDGDLEDLEDDVTALYDALSDSGESSTSDDYDDIDAAIDTLLDEVQAQREEYDQDMDNISALIDDDELDDADDDLADLEDEVDEYIDDIQPQIDDIQEDIDAL